MIEVLNESGEVPSPSLSRSSPTSGGTCWTSCGCTLGPS